MSIAELLSQAHLSVITRQADNELASIQSVIERKVLVDGRAELEHLLGRLLACNAPPTPKTLDLIGHSTPGKSLLLLGDWVIDAASPTVTAYFRELAEQEVLPRLGVNAVRLLGCLTADTGHGRWTICALSDLLGLEVYGTKDLIFTAHYDAGGFADERSYALVCASDLRCDTADPKPLLRGEPYPRVLDVDSLPTTPLYPGDHAWPLRVATAEEARVLLRMVRRRDGATMPGLLTSPRCEVALPGIEPGHYHRAQVLLDGEFVRVYPDGPREPGIVYPVDDPYAFRLLVDRLPAVWAAGSTAGGLTTHSPGAPSV